MNKNAQKGLKPFVLKVVVIAMSICYVFGPSHNELNKLLHILVHQLEMPDSVLTHSIQTNSDYEVHENHSFNVSEEVHDHKLLQVLSNILKASNSDRNQEKSIILNLKIDKHLTTDYSYHNQLLTPTLPDKHLFSFTKQKIQKGFQRGILVPPQQT
jgi:hypothetical protein